MEWYNLYGLAFVVVIMIPNIVFAIKCKDGFVNMWSNRFVEIFEQIGRFGCFGTMIFNIPGTVFGWWTEKTFVIYLVVDIVLIALYCMIWVVCWKKNNLFRSIALSVIPSVLFIFSGIIERSILLTIFGIIFAPSHILISYKNADK